MEELARGRAVLVGKDVPSRFDVDHRLVDVHRGSRLTLHRLRHERRVDAVLQRRFADRALEEEDLVGQFYRVAVPQIDLELGGPFLVNERVDLQALLLGEMVDVVDQFIELVDAGDRIPLAAENGAARASLRRVQGIVRIIILGDEVELDFRRDHRLPPALMIKVDDVLQDGARRIGDVVAADADHIADDLGRRIRLPRHDGESRKVGNQLQVAVAWLITEAGRLIRILAGDRVSVKSGRQGQRRVGGKLRRRHHLAARDACEVWRNALDILDATRPQPGDGLLPVVYAAQRGQGWWRGLPAGRFQHRPCGWGGRRRFLARHEAPVCVDRSAIITRDWQLARGRH